MDAEGGEILYYLKSTEVDIEAVGIESDERECMFAKKLGLDVHKGFIDVNCLDEKITELISDKDVVSSFNVLEHIEDPIKYIEYLYESMKSGSFLIVEVPKHPSLGSFANLTSMDNIYRHIAPPTHLQIFSEKSLRILLKDKYEIIAIWEFGQGFSDIINNSMIISKTVPGKIYEHVMKANNYIQQAVDEAGLADQIMIIAQRK